MRIGTNLPEAVQPRFAASALIVIDVQNDFLDDGALPVPGSRAVLPAIARLLEAYRAAGRPIIHVVRLYEGEDVDLLRRDLIANGTSIARPGSAGAEIPREILDADQLQAHASLHAGAIVQVKPREWIIYKPRWSAFYRTRLDGHLRALDVDTVVIAGCNFPNCPRATAYDATAYDYRVAAVADAISGTTEAHVAEMPRAGIVAVSVDDVVNALATLSDDAEHPGMC